MMKQGEKSSEEKWNDHWCIFRNPEEYFHGLMSRHNSDPDSYHVCWNKAKGTQGSNIFCIITFWKKDCQ